MKRFAFVIAVSCAAAAHADMLGDFKKAEKSGGCGKIPYASLRNDCANAQQRVTKWCKAQPLACTPSQPKRDLLVNLDRGKKCVENRKAVAQAFSRTKVKLRTETKPTKSIAEALIRGIEAGEDDHAVAIRNYEAAVRTCEQHIKTAAKNGVPPRH